MSLGAMGGQQRGRGGGDVGQGCEEDCPEQEKEYALATAFKPVPGEEGHLGLGASDVLPRRIPTHSLRIQSG